MAILTNTSGQYQIKPGDTLTKIAANTGRTIADLLRLNPQITNANVIRAGATLNLGVPKSTTPVMQSFPQTPTYNVGMSKPVTTNTYLVGMSKPSTTNYSVGMSKPTTVYDRVNEYGIPFSSPYPAPTNIDKGTDENIYNQNNDGGYSYEDLLGTSDTSEDTSYEDTSQRKSSFSQALLDMLAQAQQMSQTGTANIMKTSQDVKGVGLGEAAKNFNNPLLTPQAGTSLGMSAQDTFNPFQLSLENQQKLNAQNLGNISDLLGRTGENYLAEQELLGKGTTTGEAPASYKEWTLAGSPGTYADWIGKGPTSKTSDYATERVNRVLTSVDSLYADTRGNTTGWNAFFKRLLPGSDARNYQSRLDTLKSNIAFNELVAMREASKTGGALGQVSDREGKLLESSLGALDQLQTSEQLRAELDKIKGSLTRWQDALSQYGGGTSYSGSSSSSGSSFKETW